MTKINDPKEILKRIAVVFLFFFIIFYGFFRAKDLILGVKIKDVNIYDGAKLENKIVNIKGNAKNAIELSINGRIISINQKGAFNETIALLPGYNMVEIKARDGFGNTDQKNYKLVY